MWRGGVRLPTGEGDDVHITVQCDFGELGFGISAVVIRKRGFRFLEDVGDVGGNLRRQ